MIDLSLSSALLHRAMASVSPNILQRRLTNGVIDLRRCLDLCEAQVRQ